MQTKIVVGTESQLKIRAVATAAQILGPEVTIVPCRALSGVPAQPVSAYITENGVRNRVQSAENICPHAASQPKTVQGALNVNSKTSKANGFRGLFFARETGLGGYAFRPQRKNPALSRIFADCARDGTRTRNLPRALYPLFS